MSTPNSTADFGTVLDTAVARHTPKRGASHARFADIKAHLNGTMPDVRVGNVYEDLDPRSKGRCIQVLRVDGSHALVRTLVASTVTPRTPAKTRISAVGKTSRIALRRFRPNSRGFKYLHGTPIRNVNALLLAARISEGLNAAATEQEVRLADALIALMGNRRAHWYVDELIDTRSLGLMYRLGGIGEILDNAVGFCDELGLPEDWAANEVLTPTHATALAAVGP